MTVSFVSQRNLVITLVNTILTLDTAVTDKTTVKLLSLWKVFLFDDALMSEAGMVKKVVTVFDTYASLEEDDNGVGVVVSTEEAVQ